MAWNETQITIAGIVITEIAHRTVSENVSVANFRVGSTERKYNKEAAEWVDGETLYLGVNCWRKLADNVRAALRKGDAVLVHGKLRLRYGEATGERRQFYEIDATSVGLDLSRVHAVSTAPEIVAPRTEEQSVEAAASEEREQVPF